MISRYHAINGYDWSAIPLIPYLYAVEEPDHVPAYADAKTIERLRDNYLRAHLQPIVPAISVLQHDHMISRGKFQSRRSIPHKGAIDFNVGSVWNGGHAQFGLRGVWGVDRLSGLRHALRHRAPASPC